MRNRFLNCVLIIMMLALSGCISQYNKPNPLVLERFDLGKVEMLLVVDVQETKYTNFYPKDKNCEERCIHWSYWYVHEAKVLDVLKGEYSGEVIKVAMLQHADYVKEIKKEWYVELKKFTDQDTIKKLGTDFYIENQSSEFSIKH